VLEVYEIPHTPYCPDKEVSDEGTLNILKSLMYFLVFTIFLYHDIKGLVQILRNFYLVFCHFVLSLTLPLVYKFRQTVM